MADGFLSRWSRRKDAVRQGKEVAAEPEKPQELAARVVAPAPVAQPVVAPAAPPVDEPPVPPTLEDAQSLTPESDFTRYVKPDVDPEVKNAALKKLFSDPHFNTMDGLDVYIDDYSKPDPIPPEMLKQLASVKFLKLFEEEEKDKDKKDEPQEAKAPTDREVADDPAPESVAQSSTRTAQALPPAEDHADPDLRLQQDDAPGPQGPGAGSG